MGDEHKAHSPEAGFDGIAGETGEIIDDISGIAIQTATKRGEEILQAPARHNGIEAEDDGRGENAQIAYPPPAAMPHAAVSTSGISLRMAAHDELADHARDAQEQHTGEINQDKGGATVLARHKRESPHIAKAHGRARRGQHDGQLTSEIASIGGHSSPN